MGLGGDGAVVFAENSPFGEGEEDGSGCGWVEWVVGVDCGYEGGFKRGELDLEGGDKSVLCGNEEGRKGVVTWSMSRI